MNHLMHREVIEFKRREARNLLIMIAAILTIVGLFAVAGHFDFSDELLREKEAADEACRAAGANAAVVVDADVRSIYICDMPRRR